MKNGTAFSSNFHIGTKGTHKFNKDNKKKVKKKNLRKWRFSDWSPTDPRTVSDQCPTYLRKQICFSEFKKKTTPTVHPKFRERKIKENNIPKIRGTCDIKK